MIVDDNWANQLALKNVFDKLKYENYELNNF